MTYYFFLVLALAVVALGGLVRRRSERWGRVVMLVGGLGCVSCIAWQVRQTLFPSDTKGPDRGQAVVAYFLAQQVLKEAGNRQGPVLLLFPPESVFEEETVGTYAGTFSRVLQGFPGLKVQVLRLAAAAKSAKAGLIPSAEFQRAASNAPTAVAYVSFAGMPAEFDRLLATAPGQGPPWFVFDPWGTTNWLGALRKSHVRAVIVPRPGVGLAAGAEVAGAPNEVFSQLYLLATPSTADQVAVQLGGK